MDVGVAEVDTDGVATVLLLNGFEPLSNLVQGVGPGNLAPLAIHFFDRLAQAVRVFLQVFQGNRLGTDVTATEGIVFVALDTQHLAAIVFDDQTAHGLTQITGSMVYSRSGSGHAMFSLSIFIQCRP